MYNYVYTHLQCINTTGTALPSAMKSYTTPSYTPQFFIASSERPGFLARGVAVCCKNKRAYSDLRINLCGDGSKPCTPGEHQNSW